MQQLKDEDNRRRMSMSYHSLCNQIDKLNSGRASTVQYNLNKQKPNKNELTRGPAQFRSSAFCPPNLKSIKEAVPEEKAQRPSILKKIFSVKHPNLSNLKSSSEISRMSTPELNKYASVTSLNSNNGIMDKKNISQYNIVIVGGREVGKTALAIRFLTGRYIGEYASKLDMNYVNQVKLGRQTFILKIWDTDSDNIKKYLDNADACLLVYSVTNEESAKSLLPLLDKIDTKIKNRKESPFLLMVLGNKCDNKRGCVVSEQKMKQELDKRNIEHVNVSASANTNIYETLEKILNIINIRKMQFSDSRNTSGRLAQIRNYLTSRNSRSKLIEENAR